MNIFWISLRRGAIMIALASIAVTVLAHVVHADAPKTAADYAADPALMIDAYRHVEAASVSDAIEQLLHEKRYMSHHMQSIFPTKFAGTALTVKLVKEENHDANALSGMLKAIDSGGQGSVYVMTVEDGADIAGMGGLMGTAMFSTRICRRCYRWRSSRSPTAQENRLSRVLHRPGALYIGQPLSLWRNECSCCL